MGGVEDVVIAPFKIGKEVVEGVGHIAGDITGIHRGGGGDNNSGVGNVNKLYEIRAETAEMEKKLENQGKNIAENIKKMKKKKLN